MLALRTYMGAGREPARLYSDNSAEIIAAAKELKWLHDTSTPYRPQTNGVAERAIQRMKQGTRAVLLQSGLGHRWWTYAAKCYAFLRNVSDKIHDRQDLTPYQLRHKKDFKGKLIPFGAMVDFRPSQPTKTNQMQAFGPLTLKAIFVGYHDESGGR